MRDSSTLRQGSTTHPLYYPIVLPVIEEEEAKVTNEDGTEVSIPVNIANPNPNDVEFDNLYLDMNGIVRFYTSSQ